MIEKGRTLDVVLCGTIKCEVGKMKEGHDLLRVFAVGLQFDLDVYDFMLKLEISKEQLKSIQDC